MAKRKHEKASGGETPEAQKATRKNGHGNANKNKTQSVTALRLALLANGYLPLPAKGKAVHLDDWTNIAVTAEMIQAWPQGKWASYNNTGILTRHTPAIDIDILDEDVAKDLEEFTRGFFNGKGQLLYRIGQPPKRAFLFRTDRPFAKLVEKFIAPGRKFIDKDKDGKEKEHEHKLEILCDGQQLVVDGIHPETGKPYTWPGPAPWDVPAKDLHPLSQGQAQAWLEQATALLIARGWQRVGKSQTTDHGDESGVPLIVQLASRLWGDPLTLKPIRAVASSI